MADDSREVDQQKIDSAINELAERKNDGIEKPSSSIPQKRPSPNSNVHQMSPKRINAVQHKSTGVKSEPKIETMIESSDEHSDALKRSPEDEQAMKEKSPASCSQNEENDSIQQLEKPVRSNNSNSITKLIANHKSMSVNSCLTSKSFVEDFNAKWCTSDKMGGCQKFNNDSVKLYSRPFKMCIISELLGKSSFTEQLVDEMAQMEWHRKQMDLYEFHQTTDLANLPPNAKPALKSFYNMLQNDLLPWMKEITGLPLTRISASCSMYNYGDFLLVHDDLLSDRQIAFVYYLSPWCKEWTEQMGGALELFESDPLTGQPKYPIVQKFSPRNNQFVFFRVCKESFHQVGEVTNLVYPRLSINGWFHGPATIDEHENSIISDSIEESDSDLDISKMEYQSPTDDLDLNEWINSCYLRKRVKQGIQQHIEDKSEASLEMFLISDFFDLLVSEFRDNTELNWVLEGPANQRKYESLHFTPQSTGPLKDLYTLFTSDSMFGLLHEYTELDFHGIKARNPTCSVQLCRFTQGCYTLLGDSSSFADDALDIILFFNVRDGVGKITYLSPSQGPNEYNTTAETDATASSMEISGIDDTLMSPITIKYTSNPLQTPKNARHATEQCKNASGSSNNTKVIETSEDETNTEDLSLISSDSQSAIMKNVAAINSACTAQKIEVRAVVHENNDGDSCDLDSTNSEVTSDDENFEELQQEDALLTIHPKNNSLNLVYRLSGQTKFVKYISKNSLKPDEYVYILFATYKE
ncbi:prolyl 3-hydroxylase sudestada1 isoform X1 [Sitodiplosis mosellana]|uniref:prolyl 3-hydroxylase sudestada1 isoform X1 n=1 Tax=Sitodiplosis mosellana TaxID=263140 RepID=UPI0024447B13|nr:prolyl 3-hydroxylase sudestada1 isoform X1 [Sitodiplosis mosellana]XP_055305450.1 prolyl 3-hydroxylase sudestada1 isoform X1 [Sitodiplosis mosellana]